MDKIFVKTPKNLNFGPSKDFSKNPASSFFNV